MSSSTIGLQTLDPVTNKLPISHSMNRTRSLEKVKYQFVLDSKETQGETRNDMVETTKSQVHVDRIDHSQDKECSTMLTDVKEPASSRKKNPENYTSSKILTRTYLLQSPSCPLI